LKELEGKAYRFMRQDGLDSLMDGVSLTLMAFFLYDQKRGWAFVLGAGVQLWHWLKESFRRRFIYHLLNQGEFHILKSKAGKSRAVMGVILMLCLGVLGLFVSETVAQKSVVFPWGWILPVYAGLMLAGMALAAAHRYGYALDYIFAAIFLESIFVGFVLHFLGINFGKATAYQLWGLAAILILVGLVQFTRFLHKYPEASGGNV